MDEVLAAVIQLYVAITEIQMEPHQRLAINFV